jgi:hypothetical protein
MVRVALFLLATALGGCLTAPDLKECIDFDFEDRQTNPTCADNCAVYCEALLQLCPEQAPGNNPLAACRAGCNEFSGVLEEEEFNCRFNALRQARTDASACENAGIGGGAVCGDNSCREYCLLAAQACPTMYADEFQCMDVCATFPQGVALAGNSVQCRIERLRLDGESACDAASVASDGTCGTSCEGYCAQVMNHCTGEHALFDSLEDCQAACVFMPQGIFDDWSSSTGANSLMCRAYHASSPAQLAPEVHCPHAGIYNDDQCGGICDTYCAPEMCGAQFGDINDCVQECVDLVTSSAPMFPDPMAARQCDQ